MHVTNLFRLSFILFLFVRPSMFASTGRCRRASEESFDVFSRLSIKDNSTPEERKSGTMSTVPSDKNQLDNMLNLKVKSTSKVNIKLPREFLFSFKKHAKLQQDKREPRISSCAFLPNGDLLLVDHRNCGLKLLDRTLTDKKSFDLLPDRPWDVSVLGTNTVVVSFPRNKKLEFIQVSPSFSRGSSVPFHKECHGVVVAGDKIYVSCHDNNRKHKEEDMTPGEVCVLDIRGNAVMKFGLNDTRLRFIKPDYVVANAHGSRIYVSDYWTTTITALTATGDILFQYRPNRDDLWAIQAMYVDSQSNILVCGCLTHNVQIITAAGNRYSNLLISTDGLKKPEGIAYRPSDGTLVVGCVYQDELCVYKLG